MQKRWGVLLVLFTFRLAMAFQFQSAAALSPAIMKTYGVGLDDIGLLISLYLALESRLPCLVAKSDAILATSE